MTRATTQAPGAPGTPPNPPQGPGCAKRAGITGLCLVLGLLLPELYLRVRGVEREVVHEKRGSVLRPVKDPILLFVPRPGSTQEVLYRERPGAVPRSVAMHVNDQGFRGELWSSPKPEGVFRIACLGDSHTFGFGVADHETWPVVLEEFLGESGSPGDLPRVEVLNAGVGGYDTLQEALFLERSVLAFEPDLVLLQYYLNDTAARGLPDTTKPKDRILRWTSPKRGGSIAWIREHSRFADLVFDGLYRRHGLSVYAEMREDSYAQEHPGWQRVQQGIRRMRRRLDREGIRFGVVLFPFLVRDGDQFTSHRAFRTVERFLERESVPCLDLESAFDGVPGDALRNSAHDFHANGTAYRLAGRGVGAWLLEEGWIPSTPGPVEADGLNDRGSTRR